MSDLQAALLGIGVVVIVAVLAYNKWQEAKYREQAKRGFSGDHDDVLFRGRKQLDGPLLQSAVTETDPSGIRTDPNIPGVGVNAAQDRSVATAAATNRRASLGPCSPIDYCIDFGARVAIPSTKVIEAAVKQLADFTKSVQLRGYDAQVEKWRTLGHEGAYAMLRGGIQLVDRRGPIDEAELRRFDMSVRKLASDVGGVSYPADLDVVLEQSRKLDRFCSQVDIQIGLNVIAAGRQFTGESLLAAAEAAEMKLGIDGAFHRRDENGLTVFRLFNLDNATFSHESINLLHTSAITLEIDVPRTREKSGMLEELNATAMQIAERLGGKVVDDNHLAIGDAAMRAIRSQLDSIHAVMNERGIPAGDALALRLFS